MTARGGIPEIADAQAKAPAPPPQIRNLQPKVGQAFGLPAFHHGLLRSSPADS